MSARRFRARRLAHTSPPRLDGDRPLVSGLTMPGRRTIIDAVLQVVGDDDVGATAAELHERILSRKLYEFRAKDPVAILRAAIRKDLGGTTPRLVLVSGGRFRKA